MPVLAPPWVAVLLAAVALVLRHPAARRLALIAVAPVVLAVAAQQQVLAVHRTPDARFILANGAILATGLILLLASAALEMRAGARLAALPILLLTAIVAVLSARSGRLPITAVVIGAGAAAVLFGVQRLVVPATGAVIPPLPARLWHGVALLGATALFFRHLVVVAIAIVLLLAWCRWRVRAVLAAAFMLPAVVLAFVVAGPVGLGLRTMAEVPFSPYAATIVAGLLLLAVLATAGVLPFAGDESRALLAPVAAAFLLHVVQPAVPDGVAHWQSLVAGWLVLACAVAAVRGMPASFAAGLGLFVVLVGAGPGAAWGGMLLALLATALAVPVRPAGVSRPVADLLVLVAAGAAASGLAATLAQEVVYSVAMVIAAMGLLLRFPQCFAKTDVPALASNATTS